MHVYGLFLTPYHLFFPFTKNPKSAEIIYCIKKTAAHPTPRHPCSSLLKLLTNIQLYFLSLTVTNNYWQFSVINALISSCSLPIALFTVMEPSEIPFFASSRAAFPSSERTPSKAAPSTIPTEPSARPTISYSP